MRRTAPPSMSLLTQVGICDDHEIHACMPSAGANIAYVADTRLHAHYQDGEGSQHDCVLPEQWCKEPFELTFASALAEAYVDEKCGR